MSPAIGRREVFGVWAVFLVIAVIMTWPLAIHLGKKVAENDVGDPLLQAWELAWGGHALATDLGSYWDGNAFWPLGDGLAFSDALTGYAPLAIVGSGTGAAIVRYNLLFLFGYSLAGLGAYLLAREMRVGPGPAAIAGAIYAWAPWRLTHNAHLNIISSGGIPLSIFLLVRGHRRDDKKLILAGWAVATWQVSLGFNLGLSFGYLLAGVMLWILAGRLRAKRLWADLGVVKATAIGVTLFLGWSAFQALPYLRVVEEHPESRRQEGEVLFYSPPASGFMTAPAQSKLWGELTKERRAALNWPSEQSLWPGGVAVVLGAVGLTFAGYTSRYRLALGLAIVAAGVVAMGFRFADGAVYRYVYEYLPGWQGLRTPGRLINLITLALALLAAGGAAALVPKSEKKGNERKTLVFGLLVATLVLIEGAGTIAFWDVPRSEPVMASAPAPQLHLPSDWLKDPAFMFLSIDGWPKIANGHSGFIPTQVADLRGRTTTFPDEASVAYLRELGVRSVVFHRALAPGTPWADLETRPVSGGIDVEDRGSVVVYEISP